MLAVQPESPPKRYAMSLALSRSYVAPPEKWTNVQRSADCQPPQCAGMTPERGTDIAVYRSRRPGVPASLSYTGGTMRKKPTNSKKRITNDFHDS